MRLIKMLVAAVAILGTLVFLLSLLFPSSARLERSGSINAPLEEVYAEISNLQTWPSWNPWDPAYGGRGNILQQYSKITTGQGAWYTWSNTTGSAASGRVEIYAADSLKGIEYKMTHPAMKPVVGLLELKPTTDGKGTAILWRMETKVGMAPWWKLRGFLMDRMYGASMEDGLNKLRNICEKN